MIIHLLLMRLRSASENKPPSGATRTVRGDKVVIACPHCGQLGLAEEIFMQRQGRGKWLVLMRLYECAQCGRRMETNLFENDGLVVLHPRHDAQSQGRLVR